MWYSAVTYRTWHTSLLRHEGAVLEVQHSVRDARGVLPALCQRLQAIERDLATVGVKLEVRP